MLVLDTDHVVILQSGPSAAQTILEKRLQETKEDFATTIVTAEEQMRGWLAQIHRQRDIHRQISSYRRLHELIAFFAHWEVLGWDKDAADQFLQLRKSKIRIPSMDLKIASVVIVHGGVLLTRNSVDFSKVPGLKVEDWTQ
jgi:tRNA(fMet)-specific endonuclease VapC